MKKPFLCKIGLHWPMKRHEEYFRDIVVGKMVNKAECPCGRKWMVQEKSKFPVFEVEIDKNG